MGGAALSDATAAGTGGTGGTAAFPFPPSSGLRLERARWMGFLGGPPAAPAPMAENGRFGGGRGEAGGGPSEALPMALEGDAVCARRGGGADAGFSGSSPTCSFVRIIASKDDQDPHLLVHPSFQLLVVIEGGLFTQICSDRPGARSG